MPTVLICDDEPSVRFAIAEALESLGAHIVTAENGHDALSKIASADVVLTDLVMPELDGFGLLAACKKHDPDSVVVMLTAQGNERTAVRALKEGAYDYLGKPFAVDELRIVVSRALEARALRRAADAFVRDRAVGKPVVGESLAWRRVLDDAKRVARLDVTVLVRGETGTGKELVASLLHAGSARREKPCVRFNCAALAESLAEAELFGHERGAFTGAISSRPGYFRQAHGGTLVLDEIGELALGVQGKLLRVLQEQEVQPVGAQKPERVDVRVVASTHRDLHEEVRAGRFREDLYYRLAVVEIEVPPLRERRDDIPALVRMFLLRYGEKFGLGNVSVSNSLVDELVRRDWPGNVRELENTCARLLALADPDTELSIAHLAHVERGARRARSESRGGEDGPARVVHTPLREQVAAFEAEVVARMLDATQKNQSEAARRLGVSRMTLIEKMKRHGLK